MQAAAVAVIIAVVLSLVGEIDAPARDRAQVRAFLRAQGLERTPEGFEVDHIIPLCAGGADSPENMQLLTFEEHQQKLQATAAVPHGRRRDVPHPDGRAGKVAPGSGAHAAPCARSRGTLSALSGAS